MPFAFNAEALLATPLEYQKTTTKLFWEKKSIMRLGAEIVSIIKIHEFESI